MDKEKEQDDLKLEMQTIGDGLLEPVLRLKASLLSDIGGVPDKMSSAPAALPRLKKWAAAASSVLGSERTGAVLEAAVMIGYLSPDVKGILEGCFPASSPSRVYTAVIGKAQLRTIRKLAFILGRQSVSDLVMLQVTVQILLNYWQPGSSDSQASN